MPRELAVVLHVRAYGDSDAIISLFTRAHGRVAIFARGYKSPKKGSTPLRPTYEVSLELGRRAGSDLFTAQAIDLINPHLALSEQLVPLAAATVVLEDCRELFEEGDAEPAAFDLLCEALTQLEREPSLVVLAGFESRLLELIGYRDDTVGAPPGASLAGFTHRGQVLERVSGRRLKARAFLVEVCR